MADYKEMHVWKDAMRLSLIIYDATSDFPKSEMYGLTSQMRRAAVSIPSNIAEGYERRSSREFLQYLHQALGSCAELETQFLIARALKYIPDSKVQPCQEHIQQMRRILRGTIRTVRQKIQPD